MASLLDGLQLAEVNNCIQEVFTISSKLEGNFALSIIGLGPGPCAVTLSFHQQPGGLC